MTELTSKDIAKYLKKKLNGKNIVIKNPTSKDYTFDNSFFFLNIKNVEKYIIPKNSLVIVPKEVRYPQSSCIIISDNPRSDFIQVVNKFFKLNKRPAILSEVPLSSSLGKNVYLGKYVFVGENVKIGNNTTIHSNVHIGDNVEIGDDCILKSGAVIGSSGFGYGFDNYGEPIQFNHYGSVKIGNKVHIGANTCIDQATFGNTVIEDNVKIDNLVQIAHNCIIKKNTVITACAEISGGVEIGEGSWISPNISTKQKIKIGENAYIGLGSNVITDIDRKKKVMGLDAMSLRDYIRIKKLYSEK